MERAIFILSESLQYEYEHIAACLHKTEANCRKIYSRAKDKLQAERSQLPINKVEAAPLLKCTLCNEVMEGLKSQRIKG